MFIYYLFVRHLLAKKEKKLYSNYKRGKNEKIFNEWYKPKKKAI